MMGLSSIEFLWPWFALLLPLPLLLRAWLRPVDPGAEAALRVPFLDDFRSGLTDGAMRTSSRCLWLAGLAWLSLIVAGMRPQWFGEPVAIPVSGREMILAVDLSGSMEETDFMLRGRRVDRLTATKAVAGEFIERRLGDRIGLILFGENAYLQAPMTFDRKTVTTLLEEAVIGLAGQKTAIGDAIGLAVKRLREREESNRVLILLTDGANTTGAVQPLEAAQLAAAEELKIYTIGIGADEMLKRGLFGMRRVNPSAELDEKTLEALARETGGRYFRARDTQQLEQIYRLLDELEPVENDPMQFRPRKSLYHWPLMLGALFLAATIWWRFAGRGGR